MLKEKDVLTVKQAMIDVQVDADKVEAVLNRLLPEEVEEVEKEPREKKDYVILISDPNGEIKGDLVGWVLQVPESEGQHTGLDKVKEAIKFFNQSKKGSKTPVRTVGEAFEAVPYRFQKEAKVSFKTKEPVYVLKTDGTIN